MVFQEKLDTLTNNDIYDRMKLTLGIGGIIMYTIGQVSKMFDLPISTLRYYDKEGFFPSLQRNGSVRQFNDSEINQLRLIECLKKSGVEIKDIKKFIDWTRLGPETYTKRLEFFKKQKEHMESEMEKMQKTLEMIEFKCWYYEKACEDGNENEIKEMIDNETLPEGIQELYNHTHG